jgi:hypothetical protein
LLKLLLELLNLLQNLLLLRRHRGRRRLAGGGRCRLRRGRRRGGLSEDARAGAQHYSQRGN